MGSAAALLVCSMTRFKYQAILEEVVAAVCENYPYVHDTLHGLAQTIDVIRPPMCVAPVPGQSTPSGNLLVLAMVVCVRS